MEAYKTSDSQNNPDSKLYDSNKNKDGTGMCTHTHTHVYIYGIEQKT